jgi:hypothetical protein
VWPLPASSSLSSLGETSVARCRSRGSARRYVPPGEPSRWSPTSWLSVRGMFAEIAAWTLSPILALLVPLAIDGVVSR